MKPLDLIYWIKACLGILAAVLCALLQVDIFSGIGIGLLAYFVADKLLRQLFIDKVDKPSSVTRTGVGIYILSWIFFWTLLFTILNPPIFVSP